MNERIEELAEQADDYAYKEYAKKPSGHDREYFFREKFAELIVRECAEICLEANDHKNILRHFGVK